MKIPVYNQQGEKVEEIELNSKIFEVKLNMHLLAEAVRILQSNVRQGGAHTKTRGEVRGGGKKPWKQKGTGRARVGSIRSPLWRHGGITFGPRKNRNWTLKINKNMKRQALFMSLSDKAMSGRLFVIDNIILDPVKTKEFVKVLNNLKGKIEAGNKLLWLLPNQEKGLMRTSRNIPQVKPASANSLNILDVLKADSVFMLKDSLKIIEKTYLK